MPQWSREETTEPRGHGEKYSDLSGEEKKHRDTETNAVAIIVFCTMMRIFFRLYKLYYYG